MLSDQMPLYDVNMDEKQYFNNYISEFTFDDTKGLSLPSGLVHGQKVHAKFSSLSWRTAGVESFDSFPIPFRCVATDLLSGRPVVFDHGDLTNAMRASMSIPSAFAPVKLDTIFNDRRRRYAQLSGRGGEIYGRRYCYRCVCGHQPQVAVK